MTLNELRNRINEELGYAETLLSDIEGIEYFARLEETDRTAYMFGVVMLGTPGMKEEDRIYLNLEGDIDINDEVDGEKFASDAASFRERLTAIANRVRAAEDKTAEILAIGKEIDTELDERYQAELDRLNSATKSNLKVALIAAGVLLVVAAICIAVRGLL